MSRIDNFVKKTNRIPQLAANGGRSNVPSMLLNLMKLMHIISGFGVNGAIIQCLRLAVALSQRGHDVTLVGRDGSWIQEQVEGTDVRFVPSRLKRWPLKDLRQMAELIQSQQIDIVHTHNTSAQIFGLMLKMFTKVPVVATAHHTKMHAYWALKDFVFANSDHTRNMEMTWNRVRPRNVETVRALIDHAPIPANTQELRLQWRAENGFTPEDKLIGIVGDVCPRKNHLLLLKALPEVLRRVPQAKVAVVGNRCPIYIKQVRSQVVRMGLKKEFRFIDFQDDIPAVMRAIDLLVACPTQEAFGLTPPEAMAAYKPVVATRVGGLVESVVDGVTGRLVPSNDVPALASAISQILTDDDLARRYGNAGRKRFLNMFDNARNVMRHEEIYASVIRRVMKREISPKAVSVPVIPSRSLTAAKAA